MQIISILVVLHRHSIRLLNLRRVWWNSSTISTFKCICVVSASISFRYHSPRLMFYCILWSSAHWVQCTLPEWLLLRWRPFLSTCGSYYVGSRHFRRRRSYSTWWPKIRGVLSSHRSSTIMLIGWIEEHIRPWLLVWILLEIPVFILLNVVSHVWVLFKEQPEHSIQLLIWLNLYFLLTFHCCKLSL